MRRKEPQLYEDKMKMAANLDEIVQIAENIREEMPRHERKDKILSFRRGDVRVRVGERNYTAEVVTGIVPERREIFYNLVNMQANNNKSPRRKQSVETQSQLATDIGRGISTNNITQGSQTVNTQITETEGGLRYSRSVRSDEQLQQQMQQAQEETRRLKEERDAWEVSQEVRALKARRLQMREQLGLFGIKNWDEATPEWQAYVDRRKEYNARINQSRERADALHSELLASGRKRQEQREQREQAAYNTEMQRSGLGREEFRRRKAVEEFGTTREFGEAGYILPDGRMLDFKGEGGTKGQRGMDHRQIADVFATNELGQERTAYMNRFITDGNVRVMAEEPGVDISAEARPTDAQLEQIRKMANSLGASKHKFGLDISATNGKQVASRWYEGRVRGDRVVQDIREFYRTGKLPVQSEMDAYRYSRAETDARRDLARENRELARRNMHLEEQVQLLKEETQLSEGHRIDPRRVDELARRLVREYESGYDVSQLKGELTRLFDYIANDPEANYTDAMDTAQRLMRGVLEQSRRANTELRDAYKPVRDDLRSMTIEVQKDSPAYYELLNEYGDGPGGHRWGNVRRNTFGRVNLKLVDGPGNWDTQFAELAENHPAVFDAEAGAAENVAAALGVFEASEVSYDNPYGMDLDTAAENAAQELFEAYMEMPERHTYADRQRQKALETRTHYREQRKRALAKQKERFENRLAQNMAEQRTKFDKKLSDVKAEGRAREAAARENKNKWVAQMQARIDRYLSEGKIEQAERLKERKEKYLAMADPRMARQKAVFDERMARRNEGLRYRQARDQAEKNLRRLHRWLVQPTDAQHVPEKMRGAVAEVLNAISFNTHNAGSRADTDLKLALRDIQSLVADPDPSGDSLEYADFDPDLKGMIDKFIDSAPKDREGRISAKDLSAVQMQQLNGVLTSVTHSITTANRLLAEGRNTKLADVAAKSVEEIGSRTKSRARERHPLMKKLLDTDLAEVAEGLTGLDMMDAASFFHGLGPAAEKIFHAIRLGFDTRVFKIRAGGEYMENLLRGKNVKEWSGDKAPKQTFTLEKGGTLELTPGQAMELYCLSQRQQAHLHLVQGGIQLELRPGKLGDRVVLTPTDIGNIVGSLTPEQLRVAKEMQRYLSTTVANWGNETSMELYGIRKFTEKNYWPIDPSNNYTHTNDANSGGEPSMWNIKNAGMTKATKKKANNPIVLHDAFDTWNQHVADMASYNSWAIPLSDAMKWYNWHDANNASVKESIEQLHGRAGKTYFTTLMKDLNGMSERPSPTMLEKAAGKLIRPWKVAKVGANARVIVQQPTSYLRAAAVIDPKYLAMAVAQAPKHWRQAIKNAEKYCAIAQWAKWGYFETNLGQSMRSVMIGDQTRREWLMDKSTALAGMADRLTRGTLWLACENEVRATQPELKGEALMHAVADRLSEVIDRTQVVDTVLHRSQLLRNKSQYAQMAMNFMAEPTKSWNMLRDAAIELTRSAPSSKERKSAAKKMGRVIATYVVSALGTAAAAATIDAWRVKDDDKDEGAWPRYWQALVDNFIGNVIPLNNIPLVKDIVSKIQGYDIERNDMAAVADLIDSLGILAKTVRGEGNASPYDLIQALAEPVSGLSGVPVGNAIRDLKTVYDIFTGLQDPLRVDRSLYADPEAVTYLDMVAQVRGEGGNLDRLKQLYGTSGSGTATYAEMLGGDQAKEVDKWLATLSEKTGKEGKANTAVLPKRVSNKISWSQDGQDIVEYLSGPEYIDYANTVQKTTCKLVAEYMDGAGKDAGAEQQAEFVTLAREYAIETARTAALVDYAPEDWGAEIRANGSDPGQQIIARMTIKNAEGDKDADGSTISGSRAKNAVAELVNQGYTVADARAAYEQVINPENSTYLELYEDVQGNNRQADELAALFGASGEQATYAGMLGKGNAKRVDNYLQGLAKTAGNDVLPDYMAPLFSYTQDGKSQKVELSGQQYIDYASQRTETAYDLLSLFMSDAKSLPTDTQADVVRSVENYATQTAKEEVSDYEVDSWVQKVQNIAGDDPGQVYALLLARQLINSAEGQKDTNGRTISGSKKAAALANLQQMGYNQAYAQELYKLFG